MFLIFSYGTCTMGFRTVSVMFIKSDSRMGREEGQCRVAKFV